MNGALPMDPKEVTIELLDTQVFSGSVRWVLRVRFLGMYTGFAPGKPQWANVTCTNFFQKKTLWRIHGTGIFTYILVNFMVLVNIIYQSHGSYGNYFGVGG